MRRRQIVPCVRRKKFHKTRRKRCGVLAEYSAEDGRTSSVEVCYYTDGKSLSRMFRLDGVKTDSASEAVGNLRAVVFTPDHLSIIKGAPEERRRFLDMVMSQASRSYIKYLSAYNKRLRYKNDFLRIAKVKGISPDPVMLETVNITLAEYAVRVCDMRREFCRELTKHASEIYSKLTDGRESLKLEYVSKISLPEGLDFEESVSEVCRIFGEAAESEIAAGYSVVGPHRDDISMRISVGGEKTRITLSVKTPAKMTIHFMKTNPAKRYRTVRSTSAHGDSSGVRCSLSNLPRARC